MNKFEFSPESARPKAKALMKDEFFWSPIDDSGPFGSDAGSDAAYGFYHWRQTNATGSPLLYLEDLLNSWHFPPIAWDEMDTTKIDAYMHLNFQLSPEEAEVQFQMLKKQQAEYSRKGASGKQVTDEELRKVVASAGKNMGVSYLANIDQAIVGTAFAQMVMEGSLDPKLKYYAGKTLQREMLPVITGHWGDRAQQAAHVEKLKKMLAVVEQF